MDRYDRILILNSSSAAKPACRQAGICRSVIEKQKQRCRAPEYLIPINNLDDVFEVRTFEQGLA